MGSWQTLFGVAALFNFAVGLPLLLAPAALLPVLGYAAPPDFLFVRATGLLVACFGIGYALVARAPHEHRGIVLLGIIGKLGVVVLMGAYWASGLVPFTVFALTLGDLAFALAFMAYLRTAPVLART